MQQNPYKIKTRAEKGHLSFGFHFHCFGEKLIGKWKGLKGDQVSLRKKKATLVLTVRSSRKRIVKDYGR